MGFLLAGLGNPGSQYCGTRHNIGFEILEALIDRLRLSFRYDSKLLCDISSYKNTLGTFCFIKPQTFMNASGDSVYRVLQYYKIKDFFVLHDEIDLPFGAIRFKKGGGNGGHNGLKSIDRLCGSDYCRLRFGVGKSADIAVSDYVLAKFEDQERKKQLIMHCVDGLEVFLMQRDWLYLQNHFTLKA